MWPFALCQPSQAFAHHSCCYAAGDLAEDGKTSKAALRDRTKALAH
jgi:hypothetical protein